MKKGTKNLFDSSLKKIEQTELSTTNTKYTDPLSGRAKSYGISMRTGLYSLLTEYSKESGIPKAKLIEFALLKELRRRGVIS